MLGTGLSLEATEVTMSVYETYEGEVQCIGKANRRTKDKDFSWRWTAVSYFYVDCSRRGRNIDNIPEVRKGMPGTRNRLSGWNKDSKMENRMSLYLEVLQSRVYVNPLSVLSIYWYQMTVSILYEMESFLPSWNSGQSGKGNHSLVSNDHYIFTVNQFQYYVYSHQGGIQAVSLRYRGFGREGW